MLGLFVKLVFLSLIRHNELHIIAVHGNQSARLANFTHFGILFEAVKQEVEQIVDLAELNELLVVF